MRRLVRLLARPLIRHSYRYGLFYVRSRRELPHVLNARRLLGEGAEIGVLLGEFSEHILEHWRGQTLHCVDPWKEYPQAEYRDNKNVPQAQHEQLYTEATQRLQRFGPRCRILRYTSLEAAERFEDRQLDFVYIDARHHYEAVREDIALWYPKVKEGGLLAGDDYLDGWFNGCEFGVRPAVDEFACQKGLEVVVSREPRYPSWLIVV